MQKNTKKLYPIKKSGVSLIISVVVSFFVLAMTMAILISVNKSLQNTVGIERFNQATFAAEAGLEAAFFHHNARGQGTFFGAVENVGSDQTILFPEGDIKWSILGRTDGQVNKKVLTGVLKENQTITIPLHYDNSASVSVNPDDQYLKSKRHFQLKFARQLFNENGSPMSSPEFKLVDTNFNFGQTENAPIINWSVSRFNQDGELQTFIPTSILGKGLVNCPDSGTQSLKDSGYICRDLISKLGSSSSTVLLSNNPSAPIGKILPGNTQTNLFDFINETGATKFTLSFRPIVPFTSTSGDKTPGIPWALVMQNNNHRIAKPSYEVQVLAVDRNDYRRYVSTTVQEETAVGALDVLTLE